MAILLPALAGLALLGINDALGAYLFNSGTVPACLIGLVLGLGLGYLVIRGYPNWKQASRILGVLGLSALVLGGLGLVQVLSYVGKATLEPAQDWQAISAAGRSLFLIEGLGILLAYRQWTPRSRLPDLDGD
ncbi:MAG: hypothetical protein U0931_24955 [Vulcanimicrobiota bacterium]